MFLWKLQKSNCVIENTWFFLLIKLWREDLLTLWVTVFGLWSYKQHEDLFFFFFSPLRPRTAELAVYSGLSLSSPHGLSAPHKDFCFCACVHTGHLSTDTTEWWWLITDGVPFNPPQSLWITLWQKHIPWCQVCVHLPDCLSDSQAPLVSVFLSPTWLDSQIPHSHPCLCLFK